MLYVNIADVVILLSYSTRPDKLPQPAGSIKQTRGAVCTLLHQMLEQELSDRVLHEVAVLTDT